MSAKKPFVLRLNPDVLKELEKWASDDFRSINGQIEYLLNEALKQQRKKTGATANKDSGRK